MKRIEVNDPESHSAEIVAENIRRLTAMFPELMTEGPDGVVVNVDALKQLIGDKTVTDCDEKYGLNWHGKRQAIQFAGASSTGTLRPFPAESVNWDTTQNLMIEGENLEVLKLLQKSYKGKVKIIYIDPPYNTGKDFVYLDDYKDSIGNYLELTGQAEGGKQIGSNTEASGRFHTNWLNMMNPRLRLAQNLLREDGVLFISINDYEFANLREICNEIFGQENSLTESPTTLVWQQSGTTAGHYAVAHEYILAYAKNKTKLPFFSLPDYGANSVIAHGALKRISRANPASEIVFPAGFECEATNRVFKGQIGGSEKEYITGKMIVKAGRLTRPVTIKAGWAMKRQVLEWLKGNETFDTKNQKVKRFYFNGEGMLWYEKERGTIHPKTIVPTDVGTTKTGSDELEDLFGARVFSFPKPSSLIAWLLSYSCNKEDIVLDFFAGSGTTGHAVMKQNCADGCQRRFILAQLPEPLDPDNPDQKAAADYCDKLGKPRTIAEIAKERLRRAANKVKDENGSYTGDLGFRVFKLDTTNIREWDPGAQHLDQALLDNTEHIKTGRTDEDLLYELLLKLGLDLCMPIQQKSVAGKTVYSIGGGRLLVCLATTIARDEAISLAHSIVEWRKELAPVDDSSVVFRDSAFVDDVAKTNLTAILEQALITNVRSI